MDLIKYVNDFNINNIDYQEFKNKFIDDELLKERLEIYSGIFKMIKLHPDKSLNILMDFLNHESEIVFLINFSSIIPKDINQKNVIYKLLQISKFHETIQLLKYPVFIKNGKKIILGQVIDKAIILSKCKFLNITDDDIKSINKIRNSFFHPYRLDSNFLYDNRGKKVCSIDRIDEVFSKTIRISDFLSSTIYHCVLHNYELLNLICVGLYTKYNEDQLKFSFYSNLFRSLKIDAEKKNDQNTEADQKILRQVRNTIQFLKSPIKTIKTLYSLNILKSSLEGSFPIAISKDQQNRFRLALYTKLLEISVYNQKLAKDSLEIANKKYRNDFSNFMIQFANERVKKASNNK